MTERAVTFDRVVLNAGVVTRSSRTTAAGGAHDLCEALKAEHPTGAAHERP